jgi:thiol:disulfide interchange protein DsbC
MDQNRQRHSREGRRFLTLLIVTVTYMVALLYLAFHPGRAFAAENERNDVARRLRTLYPNYSVNAIEPSPIPGVWTVLSPENVIYFAPAAGHLLVGDLWTPQGENLTQDLRDRIVRAKLAALPLDKAVKIGTGKNIVVEVTDPDCPFCRRGAEFFAARQDVTRYIFFLPLPMHPHAEAKASFILAAANPADAYHAVMSGQYDAEPVPAVSDRSRLNEHKTIVSQLGVKGTPSYWVNGAFVSGANTSQIQQRLLEQPTPTTEKE